MYSPIALIALLQSNGKGLEMIEAAQDFFPRLFCGCLAACHFRFLCACEREATRRIQLARLSRCASLSSIDEFHDILGISENASSCPQGYTCDLLG
jgi:hypothetical protein